MPYILIEGTDGSGKDTQADLLVTRLEELGLNPLRVAEPCEDLPTGKLLRQLLASGEHREAHAALFLADRMALQAQQVVPALEAGRPVISVRSFLSTLVYQQENWPLDWLIEIHKQMLVKPDVVVWLDVDPEVGLDRVGKRASTKEVYEKIDIQQRNRGRYRDLLLPVFGAAWGLLADNATVCMIDASQSRETVHEQVWTMLADKLGV
jgi:dTMP kinase